MSTINKVIKNGNDFSILPSGTDGQVLTKTSNGYGFEDLPIILTTSQQQSIKNFMENRGTTLLDRTYSAPFSKPGYQTVSGSYNVNISDYNIILIIGDFHTTATKSTYVILGKEKFEANLNGLCFNNPEIGTGKNYQANPNAYIINNTFYIYGVYFYNPSTFSGTTSFTYRIRVIGF